MRSLPFPTHMIRSCRDRPPGRSVTAGTSYSPKSNVETHPGIFSHVIARAFMPVAIRIPHAALRIRRNPMWKRTMYCTDRQGCRSLQGALHVPSRDRPPGRSATGCTPYFPRRLRRYPPPDDAGITRRRISLSKQNLSGFFRIKIV